jgi:type IV pilus assembly protein PilB
MAAPRRIPPVRSSPGSGEDAGAPATKRDPEPLGKLLVVAGALTREVLDKALASQRKSFAPLGRILRDQNGLSVDALAAALKQQTHVPRVYLRFFPVERDVVNLLEAAFCQQYEAIAFEKLGKLLCVAFANPAQRNVVRYIEVRTGLEVKVFQAPWDDIQKKLAK